MILQLSAADVGCAVFGAADCGRRGCPEPAAVMSHLRLIDSSLIDRDATARLEPIDDKLRVELQRGWRSAGGAGSLPGPSCDTLAAAASVVIATARFGKSGELPLLRTDSDTAAATACAFRCRRVRCRWNWGFRSGSNLRGRDRAAGVLGFCSWHRPKRAGIAWGRWCSSGNVAQTAAFCKVSTLPGQLAVGPRLRLSVRSWLFDLFATVSPALTLVYGRDFPSTFTSQGF